MASGPCRGPAWIGDDLNSCIRVNYLQIGLPLLVVSVSLIALLYTSAVKLFGTKREEGYQPISHTENCIFQAIADQPDRDDDFADHLSLSRTFSRDDFNIQEDKPRGENVIVALEELANLGILGLSLYSLANPKDLLLDQNLKLAAVAKVITWGYALFIVTLRLLLPVESTVVPVHSLWTHSTVIYSFAFLFGTVNLRSQIIHPRTALAETFTIIEFSLITILCTIVYTARRGNRSVFQEKKGGLEPSHEPLASLFSLATFGWINPLVVKGYFKTLELNDVWNLRDDDLAISVLASFRQTKKTVSLAWTLAKHFGMDLFIQACWAVLYSMFTFAPTLLIRVILEYVQTPEDTPKNVAWLFVVLLFVTALISAIANAQALYIGRRICIRLRAIIVGEVYAKALRRKAVAGNDKALGQQGKTDDKKDGKKDGKKNAKKDDGKDDTKKADESIDLGQANVGSIINLMAVDSQKVSEICAYLHYLLAGVPVQIIIAFMLLYRILGWSSIVGISAMILLLPVNYWISQQFSKIQQDIMGTTDKRIAATNEVLQNIRIIKFFAWEERYAEIVNETRTAELKQLRRRYILWASAASVWYMTPILITLTSFYVYTMIEKKELNAPIAFTALSLFNVLRVPLDQLADMITNVLQTKVSVDRVEEFLNEEETDKYHQLKKTENDNSMLIGFKNGSFTWGTRNAIREDPKSAFTLSKMNIEFKPEELNIIAGPTGSGKTSMLMALLGEMTCLEGDVYLPGVSCREDLYPDPETGLTESVAYCAQQAWLVNDTIRANIVFAAKFDEARYKEVIHACALERDLQILDDGDETEVGEKGITLSGGQKQRISLARALYSSSRHLLLDDCLSAVDSHTAKWIYENCIMGPLMYKRTCILVTHNLALCVPRAKFVVVLENGKVVEQGTPDEVMVAGALGDSELLKSSFRTSGSTDNSNAPSRVASQLALRRVNGGAPSAGDSSDEEALNAVDSVLKKPKKSNEETKGEGSVSWKVYSLYLRSMGPWYFWVIVVIIFVAQQIGSLSTSVWIREWAKQYDDGPAEGASYFHKTPSGALDYSSSNSVLTSGSIYRPLLHAQDASVNMKKEVNVVYYLTVYGLLGLGYAILSFIREGIIFSGSLRASRKVHQELLHSVLHAKFRFFDSTPIGRIMNRFSKDIEAVDQEVGWVALGMVNCFGSVVAIVVLITIITPGFLVAAVFITLLYYLIGSFYLRASRDLKRIESVQKSPLYQHFGETLSGIATIRAYGDERRFVRENLAKIDSHNRPFFYLWVANRWLGYRVDLAGALVSFFAGAFIILSVGKLDAGLAGLSLTYAITFTDNVLWVVRLYAMNEQNMNSIERVREYLEIEHEAPPIIEDHRPAPGWPQEGAIRFEDYSTRYRSDLELVLKNLNFTLKPHEKVGVVGRTGAGKSSLAMALFRSIEAETGRIFIDGIDISTVGLRDLRNGVTMVPQDPTLFTGTIRSNLDPFNLYPDEEIMRVLERVQLVSPSRATSIASEETIGNKNIFMDLSSPVAESGNNLSQGQKQLLCLARALLKAPKVVVFDEATASIDYATDAKIQAAIRELDSTTITIAHRLNTIIYYDKVLVLDHGELKQFGHPHELIQQEGMFRDMCESSGEIEALEKAAKDAFNATQ